MKKTILFTMLALLGMIQAAAQEYEYVPFVREGVKWVYFVNNIDDIYGWVDKDLPEARYFLTLELKGDTVINGLSYKAMHKYYGDNINADNDTIPVYLREDDKVVYGIIPDGKYYPDCPIYNNCSNVNTYNGEEFVIYDFKNPIDYWSGFMFYDHPFYEYQCTDTIVVGNHAVKRYNGLWSGVDFQIIEGVGADTHFHGYTLCFFMLSGYGIPVFNFSHLIEGGEIVYKGVLYNESHWTVLDEVADGQALKADGNYYDLMGRAVGKDVPTTPGIYIHQGKKIVIR